MSLVRSSHVPRIAIDARGLSGSSGRYVERLIHYLQLIDTKHHYLILLSTKDYPNWIPDTPNFEKILCPHKEYTFDEQIGFKRQLEGLHVDLVHFSMVQQPVWYHASPVVTTMQDLTTVRFRNPDKNPIIFWTKQQVYKWVNKRAAHKSTAIITISKFVKNDIVQFCHVSPEKITVTYEAADELPAGGTPVNGLEKTPFIMYVGRPTPHKNLRRLIDGFALLHDQYPHLVLALAGKKDANYARHEMYVKEHDIKNIIFTGFISDAQLRWMYEHTRAYCFPSLSEGFGLPGLEAMRHGAPVVSSNATCLPEVHGDGAHYFDPYNTLDIARALNEVLSSPQLRDSLIEKGTKRVNKFSWERMARQTLAVYDSVLPTTQP